MDILSLGIDDAIICRSLEENKKIRELVSKITGEKENTCSDHQEIAFYFTGSGIIWSEIKYAEKQNYKMYPAKLFINNTKIYELW